MIKYIFLGFFFIIGLSPASAQTNHKKLHKRVSQILRYETSLLQKPNTQIAVGLLFADTSTQVLLSSKDSKLSVEDTSLFELGGLTKVWTAVLCYRLHQEGRIHLDSSLNTLMPAAYRSPAWQSISMRSILSYQCDLPLLPHEFGLKTQQSLYPYSAYTKEDLVVDYKTMKPGLEKNQYYYSHLGYAFIEIALEHYLGKPFDQLLSQYVWQPLQMRKSTLFLSDSSDIQLTPCYSATGRPLKPQTYSSFAASHGGVSCLQDLMLFLEAQLYPPESSWHVLTDGMSKRQIPTLKSKDTYAAMGWHVWYDSSQELSYVAQAGRTRGFRSFIAFQSEKQVGIVVLSNSARDLQGIGFRLLQVLEKW